jgi:hypothetical protein
VWIDGLIWSVVVGWLVALVFGTIYNSIVARRALHEISCLSQASGGGHARQKPSGRKPWNCPLLGKTDTPLRCKMSDWT